jgi:hypothetical protein
LDYSGNSCAADLKISASHIQVHFDVTAPFETLKRNPTLNLAVAFLERYNTTIYEL